MIERTNDGTTHWEGCEQVHHACALGLLERVRAECDEGRCPSAQHERLAALALKAELLALVEAEIRAVAARVLAEWRKP